MQGHLLGLKLEIDNHVGEQGAAKSPGAGRVRAPEPRPELISMYCHVHTSGSPGHVQAWRANQMSEDIFDCHNSRGRGGRVLLPGSVKAQDSLPTKVNYLVQNVNSVKSFRNPGLKQVSINQQGDGQP